MGTVKTCVFKVFEAFRRRYIRLILKQDNLTKRVNI